MHIERYSERLREFFKEFKDGEEFKGTVIGSIWCNNPRVVSRTVLKEPLIYYTPFGISLTSDDNRIDVDFRNVSNCNSLSDDDIDFEYSNKDFQMGVVMIPY